MAHEATDPVPVHILLVDDEPANLLALEAVLAPLNENLVRASSGDEALRHVLATDFAAILLDVRMPGLSGFETAKLIRARPRSSHTPIIFLTAAGGDGFSAEEAYALGAVDYLTEPIVPLILRAKVAVFVELHRKTEALKAAERNRADAAVRASEDEFRTTFEMAGVGKAHADPVTGRLVRVNPAFCALIGYSADELLGMSIRDITHPDERDTSDERYAALIRGDLPQYAVEKRYVRKGGETVWVRVTATVVRDAAGRPVRACAIIEDITARKRAEAALVEESRRKDEFLATLAHELRNPLAPIRNGLALLRIAVPGSPAAERSRAMMERQIAHMVRLIDDLLDISRVSRGKLELRRERVTVGSVVDASLETSAPLLEAAGHELHVRLPDERLLLDADPVRLSQVVSNLLNNAAKYTPAGGRVDLTAERDGAEVVIRVTDTGAGIEAEMLPAVFEMFTQVGKTLDRAQGGLGIGLALVKRLVEMHGGSVAADSPGPGGGCTFTVRLPLV